MALLLTYPDPNDFANYQPLPCPFCHGSGVLAYRSEPAFAPFITARGLAPPSAAYVPSPVHVGPRLRRRPDLARHWALEAGVELAD